MRLPNPKIFAIAVLAAALPALHAQTLKTPYPAWATQAGPAAQVPYSRPDYSVTLTADQFNGSVVKAKATATVMNLSLDDAIRRALDANLAIQLRNQQQQVVHGEYNQGISSLVPAITASATTALTQVNLVTEGFKPAVFAGLLPPGVTIPNTISYQNSSAQANLQWTAFSWAAFKDYQAAKLAVKFTAEDTLDARQSVVLNTARAYLQVLQAYSRLQNAQALLKSDQATLNNSIAEHQAGVVANIDELRARVQVEQQQQAVIADANALAKRNIALCRIIGLDTAQQINLTDTVPYADLQAQAPLAEVRDQAFRTRQDLLGAEEQVKAARLLVSAAKAERLPTLSFGGYYGVIGITHASYHGNFVAQANLNIPLFKEATFRGDRQVAEARVAQGVAQTNNLRQQIDGDIRTAYIDYDAARTQVQVARSNVDLAKLEVEEATERFQAGVADNLPTVNSQATLAAAQDQYVDSEYNFNLAKLELARALGVVDAQYREYLGGK